MEEPQQPTFLPPDAAQEPGRKDEDFVFRFELNPAEQAQRVYDDPMVEFVRSQLEDLLRTAVVTYKGKRVMVDGFRLLREPDEQYEIFSEPKQ